LASSSRRKCEVADAEPSPRRATQIMDTGLEVFILSLLGYSR